MHYINEKFKLGRMLSLIYHLTQIHSYCTTHIERWKGEGGEESSKESPISPSVNHVILLPFKVSKCSLMTITAPENVDLDSFFVFSPLQNSKSQQLGNSFPQMYLQGLQHPG